MLQDRLIPDGAGAVVARPLELAVIVPMSAIGFKVLLDIVASLPDRARITEIPYCFRSRTAGDSKAGALVAAEYLSLLADKTIGRILPIRLIAFLLVGGFGVGVHLAVLGLSLALGLRFVAAEILAVIVVVGAIWNFAASSFITWRK